MSEPSAGTGGPPAPRVFRRTLAARLTSLVALLLFGAAVALRAAAGDFGVGFLVVTALALAALAGSISAWGDRFVLDDDGVTWENALLVWLAGGRKGGGRDGLGRRRLAWRDVARVQAHRPPRGMGGALFLVPYRGRRMALDAIEDFEEIRRRVEGATINIPLADRPR